MAQFSIPLDRLAARYKGRLDTVVRKATLEVFRSVVLKSPRDTGRFVANWNVSFGAPNLGTTASVDAGRGLKEAVGAGLIPAGGIAYLSNGLPYARRLENGYSKQAPAGMVRTSVAEFASSIQKALA